MEMFLPQLRRSPNTHPGDRSTAAPLRTQKRPWLVASGILMCVLGALGALWLVNSAGQRTPVLALAREVPYGAVLTAADLTKANVAADAGVPTIPANQADAQVGKVARTRLLAGTLLAPDAIGPDSLPGSGEVLVPLPVTSDRMPAGGLRPGDHLLAVDASRANAEPISAQVVRVGPPDASLVTVVDVVTDPADGPALARAAATGKLALILTPAG
ncbi:MAG: SAF domain-containing protein [Candidatus Nanopelagicales bacterium]